MQPDVVLRAEISNVQQRIDSTTNGGAGRCHDGMAWDSTRLQRLDRICKGSGTKGSVHVYGELLQCICGQSHHDGCFLQRDMGIPAAENHAMV